jgi:hypothetical protein
LNNPNLIQRCSLYLVEHTDLFGRNCCLEFYSGLIFSGQLDSSLGTQNHSVILPQPIHAKNYIYALGVYDDEVRQKVFISPPGELTIMVYIMMVMDRLCFATNFDDMKECDAPKSSKIVVGCEFARNIPNTTS